MPRNPEYELVIKPGLSGKNYFRDLWQYRELFYFLAWRDILVRYKQTLIGIGWSVIRPLLMILIFTVVFGEIAGMPSEGVPYPILVLAGILPWQFFSASLSESSNSLISNSSLITKVYFPRLIIPASSVAVSLVDFIISIGILAGFMIWYGFVPGWQIFLLPVFLLLAFLASLGGGLWFSALNVRYRDFRYIIPFIVQTGLLISPVGFSSSVIPEKWKLLYSINPMVGVIDGFRWSIIGEGYDIYMPGFLTSIGLTLLLFWGGLRYFKSTERVFADII